MEQKDYRLAAIMYTDIAGFSRMMEKDEAGTLELLKYHNDLIAGIVERHHGTVIKTIGDALLIDFKNTVRPSRAPWRSRTSSTRITRRTPDLPLLLRIGVHLGDIYFFENDALGEGINIAARLQSLARPGCICFSQDVYNLVLDKIEFKAEKLGKVSLKNITKEIHAYEITTPNVEFDPDRRQARPGHKPGSYLDEEAEVAPRRRRELLVWAPLLPSVRRARGLAADERPPPSGAGPRAPGCRARTTRGCRWPKRYRAAYAGATALSATAPGDSRPADRSYTEEGSRTLLTEIRRAILQDTKGHGPDG